MVWKRGPLQVTPLGLGGACLRPRRVTTQRLVTQNTTQGPRDETVTAPTTHPVQPQHTSSPRNRTLDLLPSSPSSVPCPLLTNTHTTPHHTTPHHTTPHAQTPHSLRTHTTFLAHTHTTVLAHTTHSLHTHHVVTVCILTDTECHSNLFRLMGLALSQFLLVLQMRSRQNALSRFVAVLRMTVKQALKIEGLCFRSLRSCCERD